MAETARTRRSDAARVRAAVLSWVVDRPEGHVVTVRDLAELGTRRRVGRAMARLAWTSELIRIARGAYVRPVEGRFGRRPPSATRVAVSIAALRDEKVAPHGAMEANRLGLTTQVPMRMILLTSGPNRVVTTGSTSVEMRRAPDWLLGTDLTGRLARAFDSIGRDSIDEAIADARRRLPVGEILAPPDGTPGWIREALARASARASAES